MENVTAESHFYESYIITISQHEQERCERHAEILAEVCFCFWHFVHYVCVQISCIRFLCDLFIRVIAFVFLCVVILNTTLRNRKTQLGFFTRPTDQAAKYWSCHSLILFSSELKNKLQQEQQKQRNKFNLSGDSNECCLDENTGSKKNNWGMFEVASLLQMRKQGSSWNEWAVFHTVTISFLTSWGSCRIVSLKVICANEVCTINLT